MTRPVTFKTLVTFFSITWTIIAAVVGLVLQQRFNDLAHLQASIDRVEKLVTRHMELDVPSSLLNK